MSADPPRYQEPHPASQCKDRRPTGCQVPVPQPSDRHTCSSVEELSQVSPPVRLPPQPFVNGDPSPRQGMATSVPGFTWYQEWPRFLRVHRPTPVPRCLNATCSQRAATVPRLGAKRERLGRALGT